MEYEGEFLYNKKWNGKIYDYCDNDVTYELKDGKGLIKEYTGIFCNPYFEYQYLNGEINGKGKEYEDDKLRFEGEYLNGKRNGKGKEYWDNGKLLFEGEYLYGERLI